MGDKCTMEKKLRQVTDNIHETIYLSSLESEMISTPYFYRLHDIYQSSTVYMTFPSNRTKRYEHSLGTMEVASTMFFSAVSNGDASVRDKLFDNLNKYFTHICDLAILECEGQVAPYFTKNKDAINALFSSMSSEKLDKYISGCVMKAMAGGCFRDSALDHFQYYSTQTDENTNYRGVKNLFLYRCLLQAIRIIALFHDVGHPPYSHIMEDVLQSLYDESISDTSNKWDKEKRKTFMQCMERYCTKDEERAYSCQMMFSKSSLVNAAPHERIGLSFLQSAINDVIPVIMETILNSSLDEEYKIANVLYYIMVAEFSVAILVEKDLFFKSFHKIVDGVLDSDRLDYITRDSLNSGVDWGTVPYKRLVNSAKLILLDSKGKEEGNSMFAIAYPKKLSDDIEDVLLTRYKIFARINFHHRCMKTANALKTAVKMLAENYLTFKDDDCVNTDINILWTSLTMKAGKRDRRVILWNDSWLISMLHRSLVNLDEKSRGKDETRLLKDNLEEILLNKKKYYTLLKRGHDIQNFVRKIFDYAGIENEKLQNLYNKELSKYYNNFDNEITDDNILQKDKADALDSLFRVDELLQILADGDLERLFCPVPLMDKGIDEIVDDIFNKMINEGYIEAYGKIVNDGRGKTGLPKHRDLLDEIYLYNGKECLTFDVENTLKLQIKAIEKNVPWLFLYFVPKDKIADINKLAELIIDELAKSIGNRLGERYEELFGKAE